jgi:FixJ family two-component response regulator
MQTPNIHFLTTDIKSIAMVSDILNSNNIKITGHQQFLELLETVDLDEPTCLILDFEASQESRPNLLQKLEAHGIDWPTIVLLRRGDDRAAAQVMRQGAFAYVELPCQAEELLFSVKSALATLEPINESSSRDSWSEPSFYLQA